MRLKTKLIFTGICLITCFLSGAQNNFDFSEKEISAFTPYLIPRHTSVKAFEAFKANHKEEYLKQMWYYSRSFYVKRNHLVEGVTLDESIIDISRFEQHRKASEEAIVVLPGFKDVLVLLPANKLLYQFKPH